MESHGHVLSVEPAGWGLSWPHMDYASNRCRLRCAEHAEGGWRVSVAHQRCDETWALWDRGGRGAASQEPRDGLEALQQVRGAIRGAAAPDTSREPIEASTAVGTAIVAPAAEKAGTAGISAWMTGTKAPTGQQSKLGRGGYAGGGDASSSSRNIILMHLRPGAP